MRYNKREGSFTGSSLLFHIRIFSSPLNFIKGEEKIKLEGDLHEALALALVIKLCGLI